MGPGFLLCSGPMKKSFTRALLVLAVLALPALAYAGDRLLHPSCPPCSACP